MLTWMAYAAGVAGLLAAGALALERFCQKTDLPLRFAWLAGLTLAWLVPLSATPPEPAGATLVPTVVTAADVAPPVAAADVALQASEAAPLRPRDGENGPGAGRAALALWAFASLAALAMICTVLIAAALARRRWDRRRIAGEEVYVSREFGPALVGVARPAIVIPGWVLKLGTAIGATVVRHEREHARAWDHLALLYSGLVVAALPWNPAVWWMFLRLRAAVEIDCDRRILASGIPAAEYGDLLLDIGSGRSGRPFFALAMAGSESMLERRLRAMSRGTHKMRVSTLSLLGCVALAAVVVACELPTPIALAPAVNEVLEEPVLVAEEPPDNVDAPGVEGPDKPGVPGVEAILAATDQDGVIRIRGISRSSLSLTADGVARDPLVLVDGVLLDGGLKALLAGEPLDIEEIGYSRSPHFFTEFGDVVSRGIVFIRTEGSQGRLDEEARWRDAEMSEEGGVLIHGINRSPSVRLSANSVARNPLVLIDGVPLDGGLEALLAGEPFDIGSMGYFRDPPRRFLEEYGDWAARGVVFINTKDSPSQAGRIRLGGEMPGSPGASAQVPPEPLNRGV